VNGVLHVSRVAV